MPGLTLVQAQWGGRDSPLALSVSSNSSALRYTPSLRCGGVGLPEFLYLMMGESLLTRIAHCRQTAAESARVRLHPENELPSAINLVTLATVWGHGVLVTATQFALQKAGILCFRIFLAVGRRLESYDVSGPVPNSP